MMARHRRSNYKPLLIAIIVAELIAIIVLGYLWLSTSSTPIPTFNSSSPPPSHSQPQTVPELETTPMMIVYDDDEQRGKERCDAWTSFYREDQNPKCIVGPVADSPFPGVAEQGQEWWQERYPEDETRTGDDSAESTEPTR